MRALELPLDEPISFLVSSGAVEITVPFVSKPRRKVYRSTTRCIFPGFAPICLDSNDALTQVYGLKKRLLRDVPKPESGLLAELKEFVQDYVTRYPRVKPLPFEEWLLTTNYNQARCKDLRLANAANRGGSPPKRECSKIRSFGKTESYEVCKQLRWINSRTDRVKAWLGPLFKAVEMEVFKDHHFIKHVPVLQRPAALSQLLKASRRYFMTDFTAFESHFTPEVMDAVECVLYRHCLGDETEAGKVCSILMGANRIGTRLGVRCTVHGRRMSGDMCTSLGNGFTNLMLALFLAKKAGIDLDGYVEGDDGIFASTGGILSEKDYQQLGFTIKLREIRSPLAPVPVEQLPDEDPKFGKSFGAFCGLTCSSDLQMMRDPRKFMSSFGWVDTCLHAGQKVLDSLLRAKALSCLHEMPACPMVSAIAKLALRLTRGRTPRWESLDSYHKVELIKDESHLVEDSPTRATRDLFAEMYGVSVDTQIRFERLVEGGNLAAAAQLVDPRPDMARYASCYVVET
jgi:hypothetical protein